MWWGGRKGEGTPYQYQAQYSVLTFKNNLECGSEFEAESLPGVLDNSDVGRIVGVQRVARYLH
jgi:hypothetical protein